MYQLTTTSAIKRLSDGAIIPADAANADYAAYLAWLADNNAPDPAETFPAPSLAELKQAAVKRIDADTDALIAAVIGNRASEYERAEAQATAFAAGGYAGPVPACVQSWADAKVASGWTVQQAADDILATAAAWRPAQEAIRAQRLLRKEQARNVEDAAAVAAVLAQWAGFLVAMKGQLGVS
ncbi:MAG: hypothetical protein V4573_17970 [Pseudomonadota bacterium]